MEVALPHPAIPANIWITFTPSSKTWALPASALALCTVASPKPVLAAF